MKARNFRQNKKGTRIIALAMTQVPFYLKSMFFSPDNLSGAFLHRRRWRWKAPGFIPGCSFKQGLRVRSVFWLAPRFSSLPRFNPVTLKAETVWR
jgi:hypothetical protein